MRKGGRREGEERGGEYMCMSNSTPTLLPSSELFTNGLDMLATLLHCLPMDFHICLAGSGEEGKKAYTTCIKKLKSELSTAKSSCLSEIQQLFPLAQRPYEIITVKPPAFNHPKPAGEKIVVSYMHLLLFCLRLATVVPRCWSDFSPYKYVGTRLV